MYCLIENEDGYSVVDMDTGAELEFICSQREAMACLEALNNALLFSQEQKKSWLDSLIH